ncbi:MAG TPA: TonB family protein [Pyrinomonadaceae bacterium]|nr:TonB family protein [Pyrinomonadaceae bacterium]
MSRIPSLFWIGALVLTLANAAIAQESALPESPEIDARVADRLMGAVRRVRVETAPMMLKDGKWIEGPRRPKALTTYSWHGTRVDVVNYPVEANHHSGREQFVYDAKGNVVEMTVRGADGALLSREVYQYEFDELGNWKKMTRSIAVYENGAVGYEPVDVTYRTITYYFDQRIAKLTADGAPSRPVAAVKPSSRNSVRKASATEKPVPPVPLVKANNFSEKNEGAPNGEGKGSEASPRQTLSNVAADNVQLAPPSLPVVAVTEEVLRRSAIELPQPEYPTEAERAGIQGRVELQVLISESGNVTAVNPISGHPILAAVAISAAQKARFLVNNLTSEPAKLFGVLTYDFPPSSTNVRSADVSTVRVDEESSEKAAMPLAVVPSKSPSVDTATLSAASRDISGMFERGLASLAAANYEAAADFFKRVIQRDPKDAIAYTKLGLAYSVMNKHEDAIEAYKQALRLQRAFVTFDSYYRLGNSHIGLEQYTSAISPLRQSLYMLRAQKLNPGPQKADPGPSEADICYALGLAYYGSESFRNAVKEFETAVRLQPGFISAHYGLGLSYIGVGDNRAAQKQQEVLKRFKSPLANKLSDQLLTPALRRNKVF